MAEVETMSAKEMIKELKEADVDVSKFVEKSDLVNAVKMLRVGGLQGTPSAPSPTTSSTTARPTQRRAAGGGDVKPEIVRILKTKCYYEILKVERTASDSEISKSYKKLALRLHPDKCREERGEEAFKAVTRAYDTLSKRREQYDAVGGDEDRLNRGGGGGPGFDPEDIFREFFGGGGMGGMGGPGVHTFHFTPGGGFRFQQPRRGGQQQQQRGGQPLSLNPSLLILCIPLLLLLLPLLSSLLPYIFIFMLLMGKR